MGRTIPSFRTVLDMEKEEWKTFRNALDKSDRKEFDEMWELHKFYISVCSNSVQLGALHPIIISILFHHYKELKECISEVEQMDAKEGRRSLVYQNNEEPNTLDSYLLTEL